MNTPEVIMETNDLYQELIHQVECLNILHGIILKQKSLLEIGDLNALFAIRGEKDKLVETTKTRGEKLILEWQKKKGEKSWESQDRIYCLIDKLRGIIREILSIEKENYILLEKSREEVRSKFEQPIYSI